MVHPRKRKSGLRYVKIPHKTKINLLRKIVVEAMPIKDVRIG